MTFDKYFIGQGFSEIANELSEISKEEYSVLKPFFSDEKIFYGKQINFCNDIWTTVIGVTQGRVYKISLQTQTTQQNFEFSSKGLWNRVYEILNDEYDKRLGIHLLQLGTLNSEMLFLIIPLCRMIICCHQRVKQYLMSP